jgi:deazaflavin-dependent oxidoreductase (nitroreductase family)
VPLPDGLARFNRRYLNHGMLGIARRLPPFAVVVHTGRRSGRTYRTPVMAFRDGRTWCFALTYGADRDWVKNVLAAGRLRIERSGRTIDLTAPLRVDGEPGFARVAAATRPVLRALHVDQFLTATETD